MRSVYFRKYRSPVPLLVVAAALSTVSAADELHLKDGSLIRGVIASIHEGAVQIKTDFAGDLTVPLEKVRGIATDTDQTLRLKGGGVFAGRMVYAEGTQTIVQTDGPAAIEVSAVAEAAPAPAHGAPKPPAVWKGRVELGLNGSEGNSEQFNVLTGVSATRSDVRDRLTLYLRGQYQESDAARTKNEALAGLRYERDLSARLFAFTRLELEYDEFENIDLRGTAAAGLGYFLLRSPLQDLKIRGGLAFQHEEFGDGSSDDKPLAEAGYDYRLDVLRWLRYSSAFTYYVDPGEVDDWRFEAENAAEFPLSNTSGWKLRLGVRNEFDAQPLTDIEGLDTSYYLSLVYAWN